MKSNVMVMPSKSKNRILKRGDIYYADLNGLEQNVGSEQTGKRPVLIIQNDIGNLYSPTTIIAILTTKIKRNLPTHVVIRNFSGLSQVSAVCLEQIKTIDKSRLEDYKGNIGNEMMKEIEQAISISLGTPKDTKYEANMIDDYTREEVDDVELVKRDTAFDGKENNWLYLAEQQLRFFTDIKQYMVNLRIVQQNLENEIEDILDYIESKNCNAAQGYKVYKMLRERRQQRKQIMTELKQLEALTESFDCEQMRRTYQGSISKMQRMDDEKVRKTMIAEILEQEVS